MAYDPGTATANWTDRGPDLVPANTGDAITVGTLEALGSGEIAKFKGKVVLIDAAFDGSRLVLRRGATEYHLWIDADGLLRKSVGAPTGDKDGIAVGEESDS